MQVYIRCAPADLKLSTCDWITDNGCLYQVWISSQHNQSNSKSLLHYLQLSTLQPLKSKCGERVLSKQLSFIKSQAVLREEIHGLLQEVWQRELCCLCLASKTHRATKHLIACECKMHWVMLKWCTPLLMYFHACSLRLSSCVSARTYRCRLVCTDVSACAFVCGWGDGRDGGQATVWISPLCHFN